MNLMMLLFNLMSLQLQMQQHQIQQQKQQQQQQQQACSMMGPYSNPSQVTGLSLLQIQQQEEARVKNNSCCKSNS